MPAFSAPPAAAPPAAAPIVASMTTTPEKPKAAPAAPPVMANTPATQAPAAKPTPATTLPAKPFSLLPAPTAATPTPTQAATPAPAPYSSDDRLPMFTKTIDQAKGSGSAVMHGPSTSQIMLLASSGLGLAVAAFIFSGTSMDEAGSSLGSSVAQALDKPAKQRALDAMLADNSSMGASLLAGTPAQQPTIRVEAKESGSGEEGGVSQNGPGW
jgi:hypothetical protein